MPSCSAIFCSLKIRDCLISCHLKRPILFPIFFSPTVSILYSGGPNIKPWHRGRLLLLNSVMVFFRDITYSKTELAFTASCMIISLLTKELLLSRDVYEKLSNAEVFSEMTSYRFDVSEEYTFHPFPGQSMKNIILCIERKYLF